MMGHTTKEILAAVTQLKRESETWRAVAEEYKAAFEEQTACLQELQNICVATQAELENERTERRRTQARSASLRGGAGFSTDDSAGYLDDITFGTVALKSQRDAELFLEPSSKAISPCFRRVEQLASQRDYGTALKEVEHLLRGPLTPHTRVEGLLLKSNLMRKSEWLYDALATCSEALELCDRLEELHCYLPHLHYQRGLCYYQLNMVQQARDAFGDVFTADDSLYTNVAALRTSCEERLQPGRRPGFESHRSAAESLVAPFNEHHFDVGHKVRYCNYNLTYLTVEAA
jgi:tetratricopeptide (TPR) repeat protein